MKRVFYFNVTFACDQQCRFCFSHNTRRGAAGCAIAAREFVDVLHRVRTGAEDRVVINGGEPLLHPDIVQMISAAHDTGAEVVMYSNGRRLAGVNLAHDVICAGLDRITIPIHGLSSIHDDMTTVPGSFGQTLQGLNILADCLGDKVLELKFIATEKMAASDFDCVAFIRESGFEEIVRSVVFCGQVNTRVAFRNGCLCDESPTYTRYVEKQIMELSALGRPLKVFDFRICKLSRSFQEWFARMPFNEVFPQYEYYYSDGRNIEPRRMNYASMRDDEKCFTCALRNKCRSIESSYAVLLFQNGSGSLVLE